ncbi:unnamed protein product, partial [Effrenium voratum]
MIVEVCLPSGRACTVTLAPESRGSELKIAAQQHFQLSFLRLVVRGRQLDLGSTLSQAGLKDQDTVDAIVQRATLAATDRAFALYVAGGSVVTWGVAGSGGDSRAVQGQLTGVRHVQAASCAFAALCEDGTVITWGAPYGGNSSAVQGQLTGVRHIQANTCSFAAIREDGTVISWGNPECGGDTSAVRGQLTGVCQIQSATFAFAAIREDGTVIT